MSGAYAAARATLDLREAPPRGPRSWWTGWRLALQMARRDVRRDRGRSWFVWLMIAVPVALIAASQVLIASYDLSPAERAALDTGGHQARIRWISGPFEPQLNGLGQVTPGDDQEPTKERLLPGWGESLDAKQRAVARFLGRPVAPVTSSSVEFGVSGQPVSLLGVATRTPEAAGLVRLTNGRLPETPSETLVTPRGVRTGLPVSGPITLTFGSSTLRYTVVGTAEAQLLGLHDLIAPLEPFNDELSFVVLGDRPVTWDDAERLAGFGFQTTSLAIIARPPSPLPSPGPGFGIGDVALVVGLLEVALLVGPAFAIGAARQRRSLALAALSGANPRQLRRMALGQALLLGSAAAVAGTLTGTAAAIAVWPALTSDRAEIHGPLDVPIGHLALLLTLGVLTALGSALVSARGLGRLTLVTALNGTARSGSPGRRAAAAGVVLLGMGIIAAWWPLGRMGDQSSSIGLVWLAGCVAALAGLLLITPMLIGTLARLCRSAPATLRVALRDLGRHRGRATAVVASVAGGVLLLTVAWTVLISGDADSARRYVPDTRAGQGSVAYSTWSADGLAALEAKVHAVEPRLRTTRVAGVRVVKPGRDGETLDLAVLRRGCTAPELIAELRSPGGVRPDCRAMIGYTRWGVLVASTEDLVRLFRLDADHAEALSRGRLLVNTEPVSGPGGTTVNEIRDAHLHMAYLDYERGDTPRTVRIPATAITTEVVGRGVPPTRYSVLASTAAAEALGWSVEAWQVLVDDPDGPIDPAIEQRLRDALAAPGVDFTVERGFTPSPQPVLWLVAGTLALLAVIGAAMSTILAAAEQRPFLATFAAVGASPRLARRLAMTQAAVLALLATGLGSVLGLILGAPAGLVVTGWNGDEPIVVLPWLAAGLFVVGVPLVAGAVAAVATPIRPTIGRRVG